MLICKEKLSYTFSWPKIYPSEKGFARRILLFPLPLSFPQSEYIIQKEDRIYPPPNASDPFSSEFGSFSGFSPTTHLAGEVSHETSVTVDVETGECVAKEST